MKTIACTLFAAALGLAQTSPSSNTTSNPTPSKTAPANAAPAKSASVKSAPPAQKPKQQPQPTPKVANAKPLTIPPGAEQVEPYLYRYTDSDGKTWMYRQTPFGVARYDPNAVSSQPAPKTDPGKVTDLGDSYRFERKTPFGAASWVRKKTELNDEEKAMVDQSAGSAPTKNANTASTATAKEAK
jgi:hypothetical protein